MSEIKVNKITPRTACGTTQLGDSGDTFTVPSGATIQNLGTATGFGGTGVVSWETSSIKTAGFTAVTGTGYFCNTTGGAFTVTLPLSPAAGAVVGVSDYAQTFDTNNLTLGRNGSNIGGVALDAELSTEGIAVTLVYVDATKGWIVTDSGLQSEVVAPAYVAATGGCITTCGNFKMHTFTGPNTFVVTTVGNPAGSNSVDYMVVAGGGSGGAGNGGGGGAGAGGFRESSGVASGCYTASPLGACVAALPVSATPYAITVGAGGPGIPGASCGGGNSGSNSSFSTITSTGGGGGGSDPGGSPIGGSGGSGGGTGKGPALVAGAGNTPPVSPSQGNPGGNTTSSPPSNDGSGGGGGGDQGESVTWNNVRGGNGGIGVTTHITGAPLSYVGGGGANSEVGGKGGTGGFHSTGPTPGSAPAPNSPLTPGYGAGNGSSGNPAAAGSGTINTGGGGGGIDFSQPQPSGAGGSGIVIIRYKYQ